MIAEICIAAAWGIVVAGGGAALTDLSPWYYTLRKPSWQPPDWLFGPAWTTILGLASLSAFLAWSSAPDRATRFVIAGLFLLNGLANLLWSPLFFKFRRPDWALWEVPLLWISILVPILFLLPLSRTASLLLLPYLLWVSFAAVLNLKIVQLNGPFGAP